MEVNWGLQVVVLATAPVLLWFLIRFAAKACESMDSQRNAGRHLSDKMVAAAILQCKNPNQQNQSSEERPTEWPR
jgi:hypothetical protein